jgi:hypothetical protein
MMKSFLKKSVLLTLITTSLSAFAQDDISLGFPSYGGTGCPNGSASATLTPDGKSLSIIFDSFVTEAGPQSGKTLDRKNCDIAIPVHVPQGFSLSVIAVDYRGFVSLPNRQASARLSAEYFIGGMRGPVFNKQFNGAQDTDYISSHDLGLQAVVWSPCGADVNLRAKVGMLLKNNSFDDAMATVDSADINAGIIYQFQWRSCR